MGMYGGDPGAPTEVSYKETLGDQLNAQLQYGPGFLDQYKQLQPEYAGADLGILQNVLFGGPGSDRTEKYSVAEPLPDTLGYTWKGGLSPNRDLLLRNQLGVQPGKVYSQAEFDQLQAAGRSVTGGWDSRDWNTNVTAPGGSRLVEKTRTIPGAGSPGLLQILEQAQPRLDALTAASTSRQRGSELADVQTYGGQYRQALETINPEQTQLLRTLTTQAQSELDDPSLTPFERRQLQQDYRSAALGRLGNTGNAGAAAESYYLAANRRQRQLESRQQAANVIGLNQSLYGDPFLQITGRASGSVPLGQNFLTQGQQANAAAGAKSFVPESQNAFDIAGYNANAWNASRIAAANNDAAEGAAWIGLVGSVLGGASSGGFSKGGAFGCWVAREVFGADNPQWLQFRHWLLTRAPRWFRALYLRHGAAFAGWIADKPRLKALIRRWMEARIATLDPQAELLSAPSTLNLQPST